MLTAYGRLAIARRARGDRAGARLCAAGALQLVKAILACDEWRCAAAGLGRNHSAVPQLRCAIRQFPHPVEWLSNS
ncbi:MAG: hypothetical protein ACHP84_05760 [Caulobacterales bacterium]